MRSFISATIVVAIALHTVLGCCWHHSHESAEVVQAKTKSTDSAKTCRCHSRSKKRSQSPERNDSQRQESKKSCPIPCGEKCDTVALSRVQHDDATVVTLVSLLYTLDQSFLTPAVLTSHVEVDNGLVGIPPLRLHLLHQLLLI